MSTEATPAKTLDQINAPEELKQMVDPGNQRQVDILSRFLQDKGIQSGEGIPLDGDEDGPTTEGSSAVPEPAAKKLAGKFDSPEQLEQAYEQLQRKLGERAKPPAAAETPAPELEAYSPERGIEVYGETVAAAIEAAGINPFEMAAKLQAGDDVATYVDALVEKGGLPRDLVETYLAGAKPQAPAAAAAAAVSLNDNPEALAALTAAVGGEAKLRQTLGWAAANLTTAERTEYQALVDGGNAEAATWALRSFQARANASRSEPEFLGGGSPVAETADVYATRSEWQQERYATDHNGNERYTKDESYQQAVDAKFSRSKRAGKW